MSSPPSSFSCRVPRPGRPRGRAGLPRGGFSRASGSPRPSAVSSSFLRRKSASFVGCLLRVSLPALLCNLSFSSEVLADALENESGSRFVRPVPGSLSAHGLDDLTMCKTAEVRPCPCSSCLRRGQPSCQLPSGSDSGCVFLSPSGCESDTCVCSSAFPNTKGGEW